MGYSVDSKSSLIEERAGKIARQQERLSVVALSLVLSRHSSSPENAVAVPDCADGSRRRALLRKRGVLKFRGGVSPGSNRQFRGSNEAPMGANPSTTIDTC